MTVSADTWQRRLDQGMPALPYVLLVLSTTAAVTVDGRTATAPTLAISAVTLGWLLLFRRIDATTPRVAGIYVVGLLALCVAMTTRSPLFGFFVFIGYLSVDHIPGWWRAPPIVITAVLSALCQSGGWPLQDYAMPGLFPLLAVINVGVAGAMFVVALANDERQHQAGVAQERQRTAREIHDTLAQGLAGIVAQLEAAAHARSQGSDDEGHLHAATRLARESLAEARRSVRAITPHELEQAQLPDAIEKVTTSWSSTNRLPAEFTTTGTPRPMHPEVEVTLLRAAQEALTNVARHARASRVGLTLSYMEDVVTLDVRDDGVGFDPTRHGYGLTGMRQRVSGVGGELAVESSPGEGTAISASVPAVPA
ncbi:signal transduction histidine kinase [Solirubrobacter pauli]|uniref:Signal transduction histidine kinase n=1 Tax=Solirubrobacter pauli TaxID=166793 RepID=A0A660L6E7_9ACTN|nr:sensor histidine kinase [Solirubrobacter pauli]RKQ90608.1 signal transduction histidine kinase [Solirubrobacter pauli]